MPVTNEQIRADPGFSITSFSQLVNCVAKLAFNNREHVLLFRGQKHEFKTVDDHLTVIKPSIFRSWPNEDRNATLPSKFKKLKRAEQLLLDEWDEQELEDNAHIARHRIIRWAILQHYEICATPLLDVTHSLRVAASFAKRNSIQQYGFLYVLAAPQLSGAITASAEAGLQILRLSSICPPSARRPHYQEGYLLGEYPDFQAVDDKHNYKYYELDFCRRLIAKFHLQFAHHLWDDPDFPLLRRTALFPSGKDRLADIAAVIRDELDNESF